VGPHYNNARVTTRSLRAPCAQPSVAVEAFAIPGCDEKCQSLRSFRTLTPSWGSRSSSLRLPLLSLRHVPLLLWRVETIERGGRYAFAPTYAKLMKDMYNNVVTSIRTSDKDIDGFLIRIRLHQGSTLTPYLFALVVDEVTRDIQGPSLDVCFLWTM
jgi:hypothetical protein